MLVLTATAGFRHDSIPAARQVLPQLGAQTGEFTVTRDRESGDDHAPRVSRPTDILFFALTTGELRVLRRAEGRDRGLRERAAAGFMGAHSATDTLYDWPDYGRLVGAYFKEHPWTQDATVAVEDATHPATRDLRRVLPAVRGVLRVPRQPASRVHVLLSLNAASVGAHGRLSAGVDAVHSARAGRFTPRSVIFRVRWTRPAVPGPSSWRHPLGSETRVSSRARASAAYRDCHLCCRAQQNLPIRGCRGLLALRSGVPRVHEMQYVSLLFRDTVENR